MDKMHKDCCTKYFIVKMHEKNYTTSNKVHTCPTQICVHQDSIEAVGSFLGAEL